MIKFTKGTEFLGSTAKKPNIPEGEYDAKIIATSFQNENSTSYGYKDQLVITFSIDVGITTQEKKHYINASYSTMSRCYQFLDNFYKGKVPSEVDIESFVGHNCKVKIVHNESNNGNIYDNIDQIQFI